MEVLSVFTRDTFKITELKAQSEELLVFTFQNKVFSILSGWVIGEFLATFSIRSVYR